MMSPKLPPDRWREVDRIFEAALELPEPRREAYVEEACAGDVELAGAVRGLLGAERASRRALETPAERFLGAAFEALPTGSSDEGYEPAEPVPDRIGRYRVVAELGRGGWGTVYRAERDAGDFDQTVAIKVLRRGLDTEDVLARFRAEGRILALLEHPRIARLLDGGATQDGRPYLVMELVAGQPITVHCERKSLGIEMRLRLFMAVAEAVGFAHRNLVVHRDLKPSNVLVTDAGEVKLLDFGIAKLLDATAGVATPRTRAGHRPMTPEYASPEQVLGDPITTASDVYQLGLLLYEMLAGRRPSAAAARSAWRRTERPDGERPAPPSEVVLRSAAAASAAPGAAREASRLSRRLRGDLDTIVLKAMHPARDRRYASVGELAADVQRYLDGQPVRARPDRWSYRAAKLVRRRPGALAAIAAVILAVGGYLGTLQAHAERLQQERDAARRAHETAVSAQRRAEAERTTAETERARADEERQRTDAERQRAEHAQAAAEAERSRAASALHDALVQRGTAEQTTRFVLSLFRTAQPGSETRGDTVSARTLLLRGAERVRTELADEPEVAVSVLRTIGEVQYDLGMSAEGRALLDEVVSRSRALHGAHSLEFADLLVGVGELYNARRDFTRAEGYLEDAARILRGGREADPLRLAYVLVRLTEVHRQHDRLDLAEATIGEALALYTDRLPDNEPQVREARGALAVLRRSQDRLDEAEHLYRELYAAAKADPRAGPGEVGDLANNLGYLLNVREEYAEAERFYREGLAEARQVYGPAAQRVQVSVQNLASVLERLGKIAETEALLLDEAALHRAHFPENHWRVGHAASVVYGFYQEIGRHADAEPWIRETLAIYEAALGADAPWTLAVRIHLALALTDLGRTDEAETELLRLHAALERTEPTPQHLQSVQWAMRRVTDYEQAAGGNELLARFRLLLEGAVAAP